MQAADDKTFCFEGYTLDLRRGCLRAGVREIELRPKSFDVLRYLVENAGRLVPKDELVKAVWPNVTVADEALARCVSDVRLALNDGDQSIIKRPCHGAATGSLWWSRWRELTINQPERSIEAVPVSRRMTPRRFRPRCGGWRRVSLSSCFRSPI